MGDLSSALTVLDRDPDDATALAGVAAAARAASAPERAALAETRRALAQRGRPDAVLRLLDLELELTDAAGASGRRADLLVEKGLLLDGELLDPPAARASFEAALAARPGDELAREALDDLDLAAANWEKFAEKYLAEARASTDRALSTGLFVSAAEAHARYAPGRLAAAEVEAYLRRALEIDAGNARAAFHLGRVLRATARWADLAAFLDQRAAQAPARADKVAALLALAALAGGALADPARQEDALRRALALDPAQPQALRVLGARLTASESWAGLAALYQAALKAKRPGDPDDAGLLLALGTLLWQRLGELDPAEDCFRRLRKLEPAHPVALDFYRAYYPARGETGKLMTLLRQARPEGDAGKPVGVEIAELAEAQLANPDKAIEAWKQHLRQEPGSVEARLALARLYRRTEKWNALLDLLKDEIDRLPEGDVSGRVARLRDVVEIYRDRLKLDVMVVNTYQAILKLDPENVQAMDELAGKFRALARWNDLITVLTRKAELEYLDGGAAARVALLREVADLWTDRFGNLANAIRPLERILELAPTDADAIARLKEIYTKRRQWRALIDVLGREAEGLAPAEQRAKRGEMARLAAERLGDLRLAIEILNGVLATTSDAAALAEPLAALAALYDREKRYPALAEILHRQRAAATGRDAVALLERLGQLYAERLGAPALAAEAWQQILDLEPGHARALRTLRELYAAAGDFGGLERLYVRLGQEDELVDALLAISDRFDGKSTRLPLLERAAELAQRRADAAVAASGPTAATPEPAAAKAASESGPTRRAARGADASGAAVERARQVWERVLAVEPAHVAAAAALAPIYARQEKWARLLAVLEIQYVAHEASEDVAARLARLAEIRELCEQRLASRGLAFTWSLRALDLAPERAETLGDALRLAAEPEQWRELQTALDRHAADPALAADARLRLWRELARIATRRVVDPDRARAAHRAVLALAPDDREAEAALEELASQLADWPELLASYHRRAAREAAPAARAALLLDIAGLQEEKLADLDAAAASYREALGLVAGHPRALRALARIEEARGDWAALVGVLELELAQAESPAARHALLLRIARLEEHQLARPARALARLTEALDVDGDAGAQRPEALAALARYLTADGPGAGISAAQRVSTARLLAPRLAEAHATAELARAYEVLRAAPDVDAPERLDLDRQLLHLYRDDLGELAAAWRAGLRALEAEPEHAETRHALDALAGRLGRDGEWATHLQAALAALEARGASAAERRTVAAELATLAGERLADDAAAERAWLQVLELEPDAADAFEALVAAYRGAQRWTDLRALLGRRAEVTLDDGARRGALLELAALEEDVLGDVARATAAHRRVLELEPGHLPSYKALERLLAGAERWAELEELLARLADHRPAADEQLALLHRRAELLARRLGEPGRAVDLLEELLARAPGHAEGRALLEDLLGRAEVALRVARLLEPRYEQERRWKDLVGALRIQRRAAVGLEAVELLGRIAALEERELGGARAAFDAWIEILGLEPGDARARGELTRLAAALDRWPDAVAALEAAVEAAPAGDLATRAAILTELGTCYEVQLGDGPRAVSAYQRLLEVDPGDPGATQLATAALARLHEEGGAWPALREVLRRRADWTDDAAERRALLARVAGLEEERLRDRPAAIATWREVLADAPSAPAALDALERLYQAGEQWRELIEILRAKLDGQRGGVAAGLLGRIAEIHEVMLDEPGEAIAAHLELIDLGDAGEVAEAGALRELARLYREAGRHVDLLEVLERQAGRAAGAERLALEVELARLLGGPLQRPLEALGRWETVLATAPEHAEAIAAVEASLEDPDLRVRAAEILRPVFAAAGRDASLAALLLREADWTLDAPGKLRALAEVVRLREVRLGDKPGAFAAQLATLPHAVAEPELPSLLRDAERLASELGREGELVDAYRQIAPDVLDAELQRRLHLDIADLARAVRRDLPLARAYYEKVLEAQPDDRRALVALESIYREVDDDEHLVEILLRQADVASADIDERVAGLVEAAGLLVKLGRPDDAIAAWEQVSGIAPERRDAVDALEALYRAQARWVDLVELYERRLGFATTIEEAVALRVQLGELHERQLHDLENALDSYGAALGGDPQQATALAAVERFLREPEVRSAAAAVLEPLYVARQRWADLVRVYEARLEAAVEPAERLKLTRFVARLFEEQLEDFVGASRWYARVFREHPGDAAARDQLQRLVALTGDWAFVAATYQGFLDDGSGEPAEQRDVALAAATVYERRLDDVDRALAAYRRALGVELEGAAPDDRELVRRLEELLGHAGRAADLVAIYDDVLVRADVALRLDLLARRARLLEGALGDAPRAIDAWRDVVASAEGGATPGEEAAYREAVGELDRLLRAAGNWHDVAALYEARLARTMDLDATVELRLGLAEVLETRLDDVPAAIDQLEQVLAEGVGWERGVAVLERLVVGDAHRERIAGLLEPVYRERDWWQKLVVILDAKVAYVDDPAGKAAVLLEVAQLHEDRGGDPELALGALARAWRLDVGDDASLGRLVALASRLRAWDRLAEVLEEGATACEDAERAAALWARVAELHEAQRADLARATAAWRRVDAARPDDAAALAALDRLLAVQGAPADLVAIVARRAELAERDGDRLVLLHRAATLHDEVLGAPAAAIAAYRRVLEVDPSDLSALDALERLHGAAGEHLELAGVLERKIELTTHPAARAELRHAAAAVHRDRLGDAYRAIEHLVAILDEQPQDARALEALDALYLSQKLWPELLDVLDRRAAASAATTARADLAFRAARLVEVELRDPDAAIPRLGEVLRLDPAHAGARDALTALLARDEHVAAVAAILEDLYRRAGDAAGLVAVYERRLAAPGVDPAARRADWARLAEVHEDVSNDRAAAFAVWGRALVAEPDDLSPLAPLQRLAEAQGLWADFAALLDRVLATTLAPESEQALATRLGELAEERLGDLGRAAAAYERAASGPEPRPALGSLARVLARAGRFAELAAVLRRQADAAEDDAATAEHLYRLGELAEATLRDPGAAIAAYREVLGLQPAHAGSRAALERMLAVEAGPQGRALRGEIVEILEPLFERDGDAARLAVVLDARVELTDDPHERAGLFARLVELAEQRLGDPGRALDAALGWLAVDPAAQAALAEVDRLAGRLGRWGDVAARLAAIVAAPDAGAREREVQVGLLEYLGGLQRGRLAQPVAAAATYRAALALDGEALAVLDALIALDRELRDDGALVADLRRRGAVVLEVPAKRAAYAEVAALCERQGDRAGAVAAWHDVLELDDADRDALDELARLHQQAGDDRALIDVLGRAARLARAPGDEKALRARIAALETEPVAKIAAWQQVLDLDPDDLAALTALEAIHAAGSDWVAVGELQHRRLGLARTGAERIAILVEVARLAEGRRGAVDDAIAAWYQILDLDNGMLEAHRELERLLGAAGRWHDVVELLERTAELHATLGDGAAEIAALARAADAWEARLDDPAAAGEILEKILRREPASVAALTRLSRLAERGGDWARCAELLQQALALAPTGRDAADLYFRMGEVARVGSDDLVAATAHYQRALRDAPEHGPALDALERLARDGRDPALLGEVLRRRLAIAAAPAARLGLALELAELEGKAGNAAGALAALEAARRDAPDDLRVLGPLADALVTAGRLDEAAPLYERLADEARAARRVKDVARYRQRQGHLLEARGDTAGALAAYEEALRVNPTDVPTMVGVGRLYLAARDWEKARRVYQSLVLQSIDADAGITKAEVYGALGQIHLEQGQAPRAKSMYQRGLELDPGNAQLKAALAALG